ncbi:MAG: hypothetical protein AABM43_12885 [Actinomycetota bacterium]
MTGKDAWEALGVHTVTLPSGAVVKIRIPDLSLLIAGDALPEQLRGAALEELLGSLSQVDVSDDAAAAQVIQKVASDASGLNTLVDLYRWLVTETVIEPELTEEDLKDRKLPTEDLTMLVEFAGRRRNVDARGVTLGIEPIERWDTFRQMHGCAEECEACTAVIGEFSTTQLL